MNTYRVEPVQQIATTRLPTRWGEFRAIGFEREILNGALRIETAVALTFGDVLPDAPLLRIHSECFTGEVLGSLRCDCRAQLDIAMEAIAKEGAGLVIYEHKEGRGIGLMAKLKAYELQDRGLDTIEANQLLGFKSDHRDYSLPIEILRKLGVERVRLLSNNREKVRALENGGIEVVQRVPCEAAPNAHSHTYLRTKRERMGHALTLPETTPKPTQAPESLAHEHPFFNPNNPLQRELFQLPAPSGRAEQKPAAQLRLRGRHESRDIALDARAIDRDGSLDAGLDAPGAFRTASKSPFASIDDAIRELKAGRMVVVVDDEDRENEGDLTMAAEMITPEAINFMATHGRGLICLAMTGERLDELDLPPMAPENTTMHGTAFTVSIDATGSGCTTGISAHDRAYTIKAAIDPRTMPEDLARPGHIFPLRARPGGVLERRGQTEAAVDLARLAGLTPAGVICEIVNDDGTMARVPDLVRFCRTHKLLMVTVAELVQYRQRAGDERESARSPEFPFTRASVTSRRAAYDARIQEAIAS